MIKKFALNAIPDHFQLPVKFFVLNMFGLLEKEINILSDLTDKKNCAIDIGAHKGIYTYALSKIYNKVYAFEPLSECADEIRKYPAKNVFIEQIALGDKSGDTIIYVPVVENKQIRGLASLNKKSNAKKRCIQEKKLDDFNIDSVDFIKIDVEGYELNVLRGAENTIRKYKPVILIEIEKRHMCECKVDDVFMFLIGLGYDGYYYNNNRINLINRSEFNLLQQSGDIKNKEYINNFIFIQHKKGNCDV